MRSAATEPSSPETSSEAASSAPAPSLRLSPISRASRRAAREARSRSACWAASRTLASRSSRSSRAATAASCSASRPSSPASSPATRVSREVKSRCARSARATAASRACAEPAHLVVGGRGARAERVDLAVQPGQPLATVRRGPEQPGDAALLLGGGVLGGALGGERLLERGAETVDLGADRALLLLDPGRLGLEGVGVASGVQRGLVGARRVADPLGGQGLGAAQALAHPGEGEPGLLGRGQRGQVLPQRGLERGLGLAGLRQGGLHLGATLDQDRLVGELLLERGAGGHQVGGDQPGPGVAHVGLDGGGLAGDLGLPAERLELAADLGEQVPEPGQVPVGRVELAERLLLALAVLEDARGLLDEAAPVLRAWRAGSCRAAPGRRSRASRGRCPSR